MRYGIEKNHASNLYAYPFIVGALIIPLVGLLSDKFGMKGHFAILGGLLFNIVFLMLYRDPVCHNKLDNCYFYIICTLTLWGFGYGIL